MESKSVPPGGGSSESLGVFSRRSSGLVRELSITDIVWYGILAAGALFGLVYVFPGPQSFLPGLNVPSLIASFKRKAVPRFDPSATWTQAQAGQLASASSVRSSMPCPRWLPLV